MVTFGSTTFSAILSIDTANNNQVVTLQPSHVVGTAQTLIAASTGAAKADFEALLDAIKYNNSSNGVLSEEGRAFTIDVTDTANASTAVAANVAVSVTTSNDTPVIGNAQLIVEEGGGVGALTVTMTDYDNSEGEVVSSSNSSGAFTFTVSATRWSF